MRCLIAFLAVLPAVWSGPHSSSSSLLPAFVYIKKGGESNSELFEDKAYKVPEENGRKTKELARGVEIIGRGFILLSIVFLMVLCFTFAVSQPPHPKERSLAERYPCEGEVGRTQF